MSLKEILEEVLELRESENYSEYDIDDEGNIIDDEGNIICNLEDLDCDDIDDELDDLEDEDELDSEELTEKKKKKAKPCKVKGQIKIGGKCVKVTPKLRKKLDMQKKCREQGKKYDDKKRSCVQLSAEDKAKKKKLSKALSKY